MHFAIIGHPLNGTKSIIKLPAFVKVFLMPLHTCNTQSSILEHFLRLETSDPAIWLAAVRNLTNSPKLSQKIPYETSDAEFRVRLSSLTSKDLNVCGIYMKSESVLCGTNAESPALILPVEGTLEFSTNEGNFLCSPWSLFILDPSEDFCVSISAEAHVLFVQLKNIAIQGKTKHLRNGRDSLVTLISDFLFKTPFLRDYDHASACLDNFSSEIINSGKLGIVSPSTTRKRSWVKEDRRLCSALQLLNQELDKNIDFDAVARRSGLSLRSLHYLMKKYVKQSPYQYVRSRRLIKIRGAIIRDCPNNASIAQKAMNWGFQHAGRFAAYYYKHFGEYPNQTLSQLRSLETVLDTVELKGSSEGNATHYWLTSSRLLEGVTGGKSA